MINMIVMFEIFGRSERRFNVETLKKIHKSTGIVYFFIFMFIMYFCLRTIFLTKAELSARATFHGVFAATILILFGIKIAYLRSYRQFYNQVKVIGLVISLITFGMIGSSAGYYFLVSEFGTEPTYDKIAQYKEGSAQRAKERPAAPLKQTVKTDRESLGRGKNLFDSKCGFCHNAFSTETIVGPGLKGILTNPKLPVSKYPATPENIRKQLKQPFSKMPSFDYLTEEEVEDIIAFLNTL